MSHRERPNVSSVPAIDAAAADPAEVAALARRLLDAVERGDLVADDASGRRMVTLWRVLANGDTAGPRAVDDET